MRYQILPVFGKRNRHVLIDTKTNRALQMSAIKKKCYEALGRAIFKAQEATAKVAIVTFRGQR